MKTSKHNMVKWPIDDPKYIDTREGGMFVILVVEGKESLPVHVLYGESFIGDDTYKFPEIDLESAKTREDFNRLLHLEGAYRRVHFPNIDEKYDKEGNFNLRAFVSKPYLAAIGLGSTSWSGWDEANGKYFLCTKDNLTDEGLQLYNTLKKIFPNSRLVIQTWLDT